MREAGWYWLFGDFGNRIGHFNGRWWHLTGHDEGYSDEEIVYSFALRFGPKINEPWEYR